MPEAADARASAIAWVSLLVQEPPSRAGRLPRPALFLPFTMARARGSGGRGAGAGAEIRREPSDPTAVGTGRENARPRNASLRQCLGAPKRTGPAVSRGTMSEWKKGAADRRDARATKSPEEIPKATAQKKDTKRWCGGHEGRDHKPACFKEPRGFTGETEWYKLCCTVCGKVLDYWSNWFGQRRPRPEWAPSKP